MFASDFLRSKRAFTLIELLVVIVIIAVLAVVVVLVLNPAELLRQARDSSRLSDIATVNEALGIYSADQGTASNFNLGTTLTTYISIPDPLASTTAGDQCQGFGLPGLPAGDTYHCAATSTTRSVDSTGWVPVNLKNISSGSPIGSIPVDPVNQASSNLYYTYTTNGTQFENTGILESQKYRNQLSTAYSIPDYPGVLAQGNNLTLSEFFNPSGLLGYWNLDEGSGTIVRDVSGNANNGMWSGGRIGMNGTYYTTGKIGAYAGAFNGSSTCITAGTIATIPSYTFTAWVNISQATVPGISEMVAMGNEELGYASAGELVFSDPTSGADAYSAASTNTWYFLVAEENGTTSKYIYLNGGAGPIASQSGYSSLGGVVSIGCGGGGNYFPGLIDDVRIYNRILSVAEMQALYNAGH